jgi:hypothetical protein
VGKAGRPPGPKSFEERIERAIAKMLQLELEPKDRIQLLAVAVRWAAVKGRIILPEHGSGFEDPDTEKIGDL